MRRLIDILTPLEAAAGWPFGHVPIDLPPGHGVAPEAALEQALLPALTRAPCLVAFSGGRDSTLLLGAATAAARRHGVHDPIPVTLRFPAAAASREERWQELVIKDLRPADWLRLEPGAEVEHLGPLSVALLRRHGPFFPPNAQLVAFMFEHARGGSLVLGVGGDEALDPGPWKRALDVVGRRRRATRDDLPRLVLHRAPVGVRAAFMARSGRVPRHESWLRPAAARTVHRAVARAVAAEPAAWPRAIAYRAGERSLRMGRDTLERFGRDAGCAVALPFLDPAVLRALADWGRDARPCSRAEALMGAFPSSMHPEVAGRRDKAVFSGVFWGEAARRFALGWDGAGVDHDLVDPDRLSQAWIDGGLFAAGLPLHAAWCASAADGSVRRP